jgi:peptidoglycan/LPS O-acetylase OafA/YrhL
MKIAYRSEIDGLRAIAVGAVILYHAKINILGLSFDGGFIGVDIFFVISGYLITSIILKELITTGSFKFKHFYERRIRRILPALLFVMLVSLPFAWIYLLPSSLVDFSKSILYSLGFSSNFYFHYLGQIYGAESGIFIPFLHTWSLSVEEQFYILFPIVLLITFKYFRNHLLTILVIGLIISLGMAEWSSKNYPSISFYFIHTRMWELLAGSILAYFEISLGHRSKNKILNLILPGVGLFLIGNSILFFNDKMFHPSFDTLPPIIGVCLIIWFSNKDEIFTKILSTKLFVGIGLISYSLYLWHYPIFAFARLIDFFNSDIVKGLSMGLIILILSIFSYYFVEKPFRDRNNNFKILIIPILLGIFILIILNIIFIKNKGVPERIPELIQKQLKEKPWTILKNSQGQPCYNSKANCKFNSFSNKKIYLIGDSHMASIMFDLKNKVVQKDYQFIPIVKPGCLYFPGFNLIDLKSKKINIDCNNIYFQKIKNILSKEKNSIIIFGGRFPLYLSGYLFDNLEGGVEDFSSDTKWSKNFISDGKYETLQKSFINEVSKISENNKIILIYPIPEVGWHVVIQMNKFIQNLKFPNDINKLHNEFKKSTLITTDYKVYKERSESSFSLLDSLVGKNIYKVYPHKLFCDKTIKTRCITHDSDNIFYADDHHPSLKGAEMINDLIMKEIEKIELKSN